jgi:hypothetical protein
VYAGHPSASLIQGGSRMRESRSYGSVRGAISDGRPYRDSLETMSYTYAVYNFEQTDSQAES